MMEYVVAATLLIAIGTFAYITLKALHLSA